MLALGDSYTIGEGVEPSLNWPSQLVSKLNEQSIRVSPPTIIAVSGWRTDDLIEAIERQDPERDFDLVTLLIGANDHFQGRSVQSYSENFAYLINKAIEHAAGKPTKVLVLSIPDYGYTPFGLINRDEISHGIGQYNARSRQIAQNIGVMYCDITDITRKCLDNAELVVNDGLHPSARQYGMWVDLILTQFPALFHR